MLSLLKVFKDYPLWWPFSLCMNIPHIYSINKNKDTYILELICTLWAAHLLNRPHVTDDWAIIFRVCNAHRLNFSPTGLHLPSFPPQTHSMVRRAKVDFINLGLNSLENVIACWVQCERLKKVHFLPVFASVLNRAASQTSPCVHGLVWSLDEILPKLLPPFSICIFQSRVFVFIVNCST